MAARRASAKSSALGIKSIDDFDVSNFHLFKRVSHEPFFERLRRDDPVHYHADSRYGPYWSITHYRHIKEIDADQRRFSSQDNIAIIDAVDEFRFDQFIAMNPPKHDEQRKVVAPVVGPATSRRATRSCRCGCLH